MGLKEPFWGSLGCFKEVSWMFVFGNVSVSLRCMCLGAFEECVCSGLCPFAACVSAHTFALPFCSYLSPPPSEPLLGCVGEGLLGAPWDMESSVL